MKSGSASGSDSGTRPDPNRLLEPANDLGRLLDEHAKSALEWPDSVRACCTSASLTTMAHPNSRVSASSRLAAFTVVPITANSSRLRPMSPSTT